MNKKFDKTKKPWTKILSWLALGTVTTASLVGIGFGVANFSIFGHKNRGSGYDDSMQIQLQAYLPQMVDDVAVTDEQSLQSAEAIANRLATITEVLGAEEIQIQSGIQKGDVEPNSSETVTFANIYLHTTKSFLSYDFNFDITNTEDGESTEKLQANLDNLKLTLYYRLAQNYTYFIQNTSPWLNSGSSSITTNPNFTTNSYVLNNASNHLPDEQVTKAYKSVDNKLMFDLRPDKTTDEDNSTWDLSPFQKQFTSVYKWDGSTTQTRQEVIDSADSTESSVTLTKPELSYVFFRNRSGLINLLQNLTTIAVLNNPNSSLSGANLTRIQNLYEIVSQNNEYKSYMEWASSTNNSGGYNWNTIMTDLYKAQSHDFGVTTSGSRTSDPLLDLLNSYYTSSIYRGNHTDFLETNYKSYEFLYSWNFKNDRFISQYLVPIDYNNWFTFFGQKATNDELEDPEYVKETYLSTSMDTNWAIYDYSIGTLSGIIRVLNEASISNSFVNYYLTPIINQHTGQQATQLFNAYFNNFLDSFVTSIPNVQNHSITGINAFNGAIIGLSVAIVAIGIIVSILYRVPGALMAFSAITSFGLNLLMMSNLSITFSISSIFALIVGIVAMFIPFCFAMKEFRDAFKKQHLNLNNSFKKSLISFTKSSIIIDVSILIIALVYLFFGSYQIQNFGATLTLIGISNLVCCFCLMLALFNLVYFLKLRHNPQLMFSKDEIKVIDSIKKNRMKFSEDITVYESKLDKISNAIANQLVTYNWKTYLVLTLVVVASIVGTILLFTLGPGNSLYFEYSNQITIVFTSSTQNQETAYTIANKLAEQLNLTWISSQLYENLYAGGYDQLLLVPSTTINPSDLFSAMQTIEPTWVGNVQLLSINTYFTNLLINNLVECIFIALAFMMIFNLLLLNIISVIPIFVVSLVTILFGCGVIGITRINVNLNTISAFSCIFIALQLLIEINYMNLKINYDIQTRMSNKEIVQYSLKQTRELLMLSLAILASLWIIVFIMVLFDSSTNLLNYLIIWLCSIFGTIGVLLLTPILFASFMMIRELYVSNVIASNKKHKSEHKSYDKIDEQVIVGINHS